MIRTIYLFLAMTLKNFALDDGNDKLLKSVSEIGSMLFTRGVSGTRVITGREEKIFQGNHVFKGKCCNILRYSTS